MRWFLLRGGAPAARQHVASLALLVIVLHPLLGAGAGSGRAVAPLRLEGLIAAAFTAYHEDGSVNLDVVPKQAEYLQRTGARGVLVAGTTGDSLGLTVPERRSLAEAWAHAAKAAGLQLLVHVGAEALPDVLELARHAEWSGAAALVCMPSTFFKPATVEAAALWLQAVGGAAPSLPLYYYHIPSMTGVGLVILDLIRAVEVVGVPTFAGVKFTGLYENRAFPDLERAQRYGLGRYDLYSGREEMMVQALSIGVRGFIGSQFNFAADLYMAVQAAWPNATRASELQAVAVDLLYSWMQAVPAGVDGNRLVMGYAGIDLGPARLPSLPADANAILRLNGTLSHWCESAGPILGQLPELCRSAQAIQRSPGQVKGQSADL